MPYQVFGKSSGAAFRMTLCSRSDIVRSGSGILVMAASTSFSPSAPRFAFFSSRARSFMAARSSAVNPDGLLVLVVFLSAMAGSPVRSMCMPKTRWLRHRAAIVPCRIVALNGLEWRRSVAVGCAQREQWAIGSPAFYAARERGPFQQPRAIGVHIEELLADPVRPVRVEQRGRGRAVGEAEGGTRGPFASGHVVVQPGIGGVQRVARFFDAVGVAVRFRPQLVEHDFLLRAGNVVVEEAIQHAHIHGLVRVARNQPRWSGMMDMQVFDDAGGLHHLAPAIHQQREFPDRPALRELGVDVGIVGRQVQEFERDVVFVQRGQRLLGVGRKRVAIELHVLLQPWISCLRRTTVAAMDTAPAAPDAHCIRSAASSRLLAMATVAAEWRPRTALHRGMAGLTLSAWPKVLSMMMPCRTRSTRRSPTRLHVRAANNTRAPA